MRSSKTSPCAQTGICVARLGAGAGADERKTPSLSLLLSQPETPKARELHSAHFRRARPPMAFSGPDPRPRFGVAPECCILCERGKAVESPLFAWGGRSSSIRLARARARSCSRCPLLLQTTHLDPSQDHSFLAPRGRAETVADRARVLEQSQRATHARRVSRRAGKVGRAAALPPDNIFSLLLTELRAT
jgi:hypothetical protein